MYNFLKKKGLTRLSPSVNDTKLLIPIAMSVLKQKRVYLLIYLLILIGPMRTLEAGKKGLVPLFCKSIDQAEAEFKPQSLQVRRVGINAVDMDVD